MQHVSVKFVNFYFCLILALPADAAALGHHGVDTVRTCTFLDNEHSRKLLSFGRNGVEYASPGECVRELFRRQCILSQVGIRHDSLKCSCVIWTRP